MHSASLDTQNPLAAKLQKAKKEDRNNHPHHHHQDRLNSFNDKKLKENGRESGGDNSHVKKNEKHSEGEHDYLNNIQCRGLI